MNARLTGLRSTLVAACFLNAAAAAVLDLQIERRSEVAGGSNFGAAGKYERISGRARFAIDPNAPSNRGITDIRLVPRNSQGLVEFSADVYVIRPVDLSKGNRTVLFEVVNRGKKGMLPIFNRARSSNDPVVDEDFGDGLLLRKGYTLVWLGWQHDVPAGNNLMRLYPPLVQGMRGLVRSEYTAVPGTTHIPLGDVGHTAYPVADERSIRVSVRRDVYGRRIPLHRSAWKFDTGERILLSKPASEAAIYEVIYESENPPVAGAGLAAIRDLISFFRRDYRYVIGFGISQSAMVLRALIYEGFNADENGRQVFDGIFAHVAGGRRSTFQRFTQPSRTAGPLRNASLSTTEQFPFSDVVQRNPNTGREDGLLAKAIRANVVPRIFYTNSTYEYWGSGGSLIHTTPDGTADVPLPSSTRLYVFSGGQHGPASFPPAAGRGRNLPNFNDYTPVLRALLERLHGWVTQNQSPPGSVYPKISAKTLVPLSRYRFSGVPGVAVPGSTHVPHALDFGPAYRTDGIVSLEPPRVISPYRPLVPQADADGNDLGGLRLPEIGCALGTFTGWNLRGPAIGLDHYLLANTGSYLPFPLTRADRSHTRDGRRAIEERYADQQSFVSCVDASSDELIAAGLLLPVDKDRIRERAVQHWQWRIQESPLLTSNQRE